MIMPLKGGGLLIRGLHCSTRSQGLVVEFLEKWSVRLSAQGAQIRNRELQEQSCPTAHLFWTIVSIAQPQSKQFLGLFEGPGRGEQRTLGKTCVNLNPKLYWGHREPHNPKSLSADAEGPSGTWFRWTPHPVMVTTVDNGECIRN